MVLSIIILWSDKQFPLTLNESLYGPKSFSFISPSSQTVLDILKNTYHTLQNLDGLYL